jgi:hypothetical protein
VIYALDVATKLGFLAVLLALAATVAGCGGSSKKSASSPTTPSTTSVAPETTGPATTAKTATPTFATAHNCQQLIALGQQFAKAVSSTSGSEEARLSADTKALQAMAAAAPSDIRADFQTLAAAFDKFVQAYTKAGISPGKTPTASQLAQIEAASRSFSTAKLRTAERHLTTWAQKNCGGLGVTTTG